jgi:hypothetical protein
MSPPAGRWGVVTPYPKSQGALPAAGSAAARMKAIAARGRGEAPPPEDTPTAAPGTCPRCGRKPGVRDLVCAMCGEILPKPTDPVLHATVPEKSDSWVTGDVAVRRGFASSVPEDLRYLAIGLGLAPVLAATPLLQYMGWFLESLFHETGHAAAGWALGCPAYPAIRLDGHAAAVHAPQVWFLCAGWMVLLAALAWGSRKNHVRLAIFGGALLLYPLIAFTSAQDAVFLLAGHVGELVFATILLVQAVDGGLSGEPLERSAHSMVGWYLVGSNVWLCGGLLFSESARSGYETSGSFGLENDLLRLSNEVLPLSLGTIAGTILVLALAVPAVALAIGRRAAED